MLRDPLGLRELVARRSTPDRRGSSRRRSRCRAGAAGRRASAASPRRRARSRSRSSRCPRRTPRRSPRRSATRRARRAGARRGRRATRRRRSRAGRPSRPASARPASRPRRAPPARSARSRAAAKRGCGTPASASVRRIAILCVIRCAVSAPDPRQAERLGHRCDDRHGPVGRDRQHAVDAVTARDLGDRVDVGEVDGLAHVRRGEPERVGVPVDGDDAQAELLRARRIARRWWPARADEEDASSTGATLDEPSRNRGCARACSAAARPRVAAGVEPRQQERDPARARDLAAVRRGERAQTARPRSLPRDQRLLRAAVLLGARRRHGISAANGFGSRFASLRHAVAALGRLRPRPGRSAASHVLASPSSAPVGPVP